MFSKRFSPLLPGFLILTGGSLLTRISLLISSASSFDWSFFNLLKIFSIGLFFDLAVAFYAFIPLVIYLWLVPFKWYRHRLNLILLSIYFFVVILTLSFNVVSEWVFWQEFSVRYNFIAVDYLVYTTEVIGNIRQSYPVNTILFILMLFALSISLYIKPRLWKSASDNIRFKGRSAIAIPLLLIPVGSYFLIKHDWRDTSQNPYVNELSGNGMYDFGYAFWHNELEYDTFYQTLPADSIRFTPRKISGKGPEKHMNIVLISVESLSADFLGAYGNQKNITPNLDSLAKESLLFTRLYASGTRTVRGLEALSLSIPPTPGQSIVKRPDNHNLFTLGNVLRAKGYHSRYIYGGYGYFDNMSEFFSQNGYDVTDRSTLKENEIHYSNIWGVADEDLFTLSLRELDADYKQGKPFFAHIMTVSNHRPYTYPDGRIDIPSHTGREGAVKYTDYAIGKFIREAKSKPWFQNTVFIIVADHCASSAGKVELPVEKYHIPMLIYAPGFITPGRFDKLTAQIDIAPSILGLLNFSYESKFFGQNVFSMADEDQRAFISTYQSLGYIKNNKLVILDPNKKVATCQVNLDSGSSIPVEPDKKLINEAIRQYQTASYLYKNDLYRFGKQKN